jgi:cytoskeletal protein RodZ
VASVAEQLKSTREALGLSVKDVVEQTNLKTDQVEALESGSWNSFAAPVYVRGFVRSYAQLLKLPGDELTRALDVELGVAEKSKEVEGELKPNRSAVNILMLWLSRVNWKVALPVFIFLGLVAGTYFGVQAWQNRPASATATTTQLGTGLIDDLPAAADYDHLTPGP